MDSDSGNHVCCYNSAAAQRIRTKLGQDDHCPCPEVSYDFDLNLTFNLDIGAKKAIFALKCIFSYKLDVMGASLGHVI